MATEQEQDAITPTTKGKCQNSATGMWATRQSGTFDMLWQPDESLASEFTYNSYLNMKKAIPTLVFYPTQPV